MARRGEKPSEIQDWGAIVQHNYGLPLSFLRQSIAICFITFLIKLRLYVGCHREPGKGS